MIGKKSQNKLIETSQELLEVLNKMLLPTCSKPTPQRLELDIAMKNVEDEIRELKQ